MIIVERWRRRGQRGIRWGEGRRRMVRVNSRRKVRREPMRWVQTFTVS